MNSTVTIGIDVPNLEQGVLFYTRAFGFTKKAASIPGLAVLHGLNVELCLLEKAPGSRPSISTSDFRRYERHWTPVHFDIHVDDLQSALQGRGLCDFRDLVRPAVNGGKIPPLVAGARDVESRAQSRPLTTKK
jgi:hypothetical protein